MEVHHHTHHSHGKKNWRSYGWEFLMLFLAVFCGFLAEYQLEHKIEKDREKVFIRNLLEDLKDDLEVFDNYAAVTAENKDIVDSLFLYTKMNGLESHLSDAYFKARKVTIQKSQVIPNQRTYEQMKSSGQLRVIHNEQIASAISKYYLSIAGIIDQNEVIQGKLNLYQTEIGNVFDAAVLWEIFNTRKPSARTDLKLMTKDPVVVNRFLTAAQYFVGSQLRQRDRTVEASNRCKELIKIIKEEYGLE